MCLIFSLVPATFWVIVGYFVLYSSARADGRVKSFGRVLAVWVFVLAALIPVMAAYITFAAVCPINTLIEGSGLGV